jgi:hypothetical protein
MNFFACWGAVSSFAFFDCAESSARDQSVLLSMLGGAVCVYASRYAMH